MIDAERAQRIRDAARDGAWRDAPPPGDGDAPPNGHAREERAEPEQPRRTYARPLRAFLGDEEPDEDDTHDWCIRGLVARDVVTLFAGDPKVGKTMIAEDWAIALAAGDRDWCGFAIPRRCRVLLMPREDSERTTRIRIWQIARARGLDPRELDGWLAVEPFEPLNFGSATDVAALRADMRGFDVLIVDSFTTAHRGDENSARDVAAIMGAARDLCGETRCSTVFLHHFNGKGGDGDKRGVKHRLRGSSAMAGYARHIVGASRIKGARLVEIETDGNLAYQPEPFCVELVVGTRADGRKTLRYVHRGSQRELAAAARDARVAAAIRKALLEAGPAGLGTRDLRAAVNAILREDGKGVRPAAIDTLAAEMVAAGELHETSDGRRALVGGPARGVSGGVSGGGSDA